MTVTATKRPPVNEAPVVRPPGLFEKVVKNVQSLFKTEKSFPVPPKGYREILPYGFVSRNYIQYMSRSVSREQLSALKDGTSVCKFQNGGVLLEAKSGHIVELDKTGRVVLVRVHNIDVENTANAEDLNVAFKGAQMRLPGGISIASHESEVLVTLPNGTVFSHCL